MPAIRGPSQSTSCSMPSAAISCRELSQLWRLQAGVVFFASGGGTVSAFDLLAGSKTITGMTMARFVRTNRALYDRHGEQLWTLMLEGSLRPAIHAQMPLSDAAHAHEIIEARANRGKIVLLP